jgi:hypothetical protein
MSARKGVTTLLLLFVGVSVVYLIVNESTQRRQASREAETAAVNEPESRAADGEGALEEASTVVVYYFHGNRRCNTCRTIEAYTEEAIRSGFPEELRNGQVEWRAVNIDQPENKHFIDDFELSTRSVVFVDMRNGAQQKWLKLEKVWELVRDRPGFFDYIQGNLLDFLRESHG